MESYSHFPVSYTHLEEAVETVIEACNGTDERLIYEGADLLYHLIVLLTSKGCLLYTSRCV